MSAALSRSTLPLPTANFEACPECGRPWHPGHQCSPRTARAAADDACPICGYWRCHCTQSRRVAAIGVIRRAHGRTTRLTATPAGITGSISPAVAR